MENYCIYSHSTDFDQILQKVRLIFPQSAPVVAENDGIRTIRVELKKGLFGKKERFTINYRERQEPSFHLKNGNCEVTNQIRGMYNFVSSLPVQEENLQSLLLRKIETINSETILLAEPVLSSDMEKLLRDLAGSLDALVFMPPKLRLSQSSAQHFTDKSFRLLTDTNGNTGDGELTIQIATKYYDDQAPPTPAQVNRKKQTEAFLEQYAVKINRSLPAVPDGSDVTLREKQAVIERVYSLTVLAAKGEGVPAERLEEERERLSINGLTRLEWEIYQKTQLSEQERANATWRYESLNVLLWSLGFVGELVFPSLICDVPHIVGTVIKQSREELEQKAVFRGKEEILDQLDLVYRMHWACVDARIHGQQPQAGMHPSIVYERHYALNWLTNHHGEDWDGVSTPT